MPVLSPEGMCVQLRSTQSEEHHGRARKAMGRMGIASSDSIHQCAAHPPVTFPFKGYTQNISVFYLSSNSRLQCDFSFRLY